MTLPKSQVRINFEKTDNVYHVEVAGVAKIDFDNSNDCWTFIHDVLINVDTNVSSVYLNNIPITSLPRIISMIEYVFEVLN